MQRSGHGYSDRLGSIRSAWELAASNPPSATNCRIAIAHRILLMTSDLLA
jgi:hypothetical protein